MNHRNQIVITTLRGRQVLIYMENEKIYDVLVSEEQADSLCVGNIYMGRVQNIIENINAAFIEVEKNEICFLPLTESKDTIKCGDEMVVQVKKAAVKKKQAVVTRYPEIAGRYCVVTTKNKSKSISSKITDAENQKHLRELLSDWEKEEYGIVLRTNAETADKEDICAEITMLVEQMHTILEKSQYKTCFSRLRKEDSFYRKYINGCQMTEIDRIITDDTEVFNELSKLYPNVCEQYQDVQYPLDKLLGLSSKLQKAYEKRAWLKSGGNLVIEPTEALTVIDVNTGKAIEQKRNKETTFFKINCEAAVEAARQIRMRNLSGIIIIDFIDMQNKSNETKLMNLLRMELRKDKTRSALVDITRLGLVELTRMKKNKPLWEVLPEQDEKKS